MLIIIFREENPMSDSLYRFSGEDNYTYCKGFMENEPVLWRKDTHPAKLHNYLSKKTFA